MSANEEEKATENTEKGENKSRSKGGKTPKAVMSKTRALAEIGISADDDEREATSKKISWVLRDILKKGSARIAIETQEDKWVKVMDFVNCDLMDDLGDRSEEKLLTIINESNEQKLRYELKDGADGKLIRALKREDRKAGGKAPAGATPKPANVKDLADKVSELSASAPAFVPGAQGGAGAAMSYPGWSYPGYGASYGGGYSPWGYGYGGPSYGGYGYGGGGSYTESGKKKFEGRIKSFNTEKGFGFVESAETHALYGRDVFLHKAHIGNNEVGSWITFSVELDKEKGFPQAREVTGADGQTSKGKAKGKGKGKGKEGGKGKGKKDGDKKDGGKDSKKEDDKADGDKSAEAPTATADADKS